MTDWPESAILVPPVSGITARIATAISVDETRTIAGIPR